MPIAKSQKSEKKIRYDIQALRAFAVASVVLYHLWPGRLEGGFTGVDIFFVISGYLMTVSIMGRLNPLADTGTITVKNVLHLLTEFYARRIKRLVPAALVTLVGILGMSALTNNLTIIIDNAKNVISAATFWENWHLAKQSVDYLHSGDAPVAAQHFWSLSLEEQFYLMWPLVLIVATLITLNIVIYYKRQKIAGAILPITLITIASLAYGYWLTQSEPSIAYFSTPARVWELMIGGIIAFLPVIKNYDLKLLLPHVGLAMCLYSIFFVTGDGFPGWHALIPTIGAALIVMGGTGKTESSFAFDNLFRWRPIQWIGDISYSVYLWHWPLIILLPVLLRRDIEGEHSALFKLGIIVLSLIIAHLSYKFVEEPVRKIQLKTRYVYLLFIILTGLVAVGGFALKQYGDKQAQSRLDSMHAAAMDPGNLCFGARAILHKDKCDNPYGKTDARNMSVGEQDVFFNAIQDNFSLCPYIRKTIAFSDNTNQANFCVYGDPTATKSIALFGDSHMQQYLNAFHDIGLRNNYKIYLLDIAGCYGEDFVNKSPACTARYDAVRKSKSLFDESSLLVVSFLYRGYDYIVKNLEFLRSITDKDFVFFQDNAHSTAAKFKSCYLISRNCAMSKDTATKQGNTILEKLIKAEKIKQEQVLSTEDFFCDLSTCYSSIGGVPVYYNTAPTFPKPKINSHITASYSLSLSPLIEFKLRQLNFLR